MRDQTTPPFRTGDTAYTRPAPGGYASAAAVPTDPAFGGTDQAYAVPSLGGDFVPGSGAPSPTGSPIAKGSDADGGASDIANAPRVGAPAPVPPPTPPALSVAVSGRTLVFAGVPALAATVTVTYRVNGSGTDSVMTVPITANSSTATVAAKVANSIMQTPTLTGTSHSNAVEVGTKTPHVLNTLACTVA